MRKLITLSLLFVFFIISQNNALAQSNVVNRLRDVKTVYLDESSFRLKFSSCGKIFGGILLPCSKHSVQRQEFLAALNRWLEKYDFTLTTDKQKADAILQGELSIDDYGYRNYKSAGINKTYGKNTKNRKGESQQIKENKPQWQVVGWLINQSGDKLWTKGGWYPEPGYGWSELSKIEAKKLARELQYDFEKSK
jgi:hypothetical protein